MSRASTLAVAQPLMSSWSSSWIRSGWASARSAAALTSWASVSIGCGMTPRYLCKHFFAITGVRRTANRFERSDALGDEGGEPGGVDLAQHAAGLHQPGGQVQRPLHERLATGL